MIKNNLCRILNSKDLRITKVSKDTGISRTTLTAMCNDSTRDVSLKTLDTLCSYLNCNLTDLIIREEDNNTNDLTELISGLCEDKRKALHELLK